MKLAGLRLYRYELPLTEPLELRGTTLRLASRAQRLGITPVISSAYETGVGTLALVALAAGVGEVPAGLGTHRRLAGDVLDPRPRLGSARIDVREITGTRRGMDHRWLTSVE